MKKLIYLWLLASVLLPAACTDDDDVFSEESGVRLQAVIDECNTTLRGAENGWKWCITRKSKVMEAILFFSSSGRRIGYR